MQKPKIPNKLPRDLEEIATDELEVIGEKLNTLLLLAYQKGFDKGTKTH